MPVCTGCGVGKVETEFHWKDKIKGTRVKRCKRCHYHTMKDWYARHPEKAREQSREWARKNYAKIKARRRERAHGVSEDLYRRMLAQQKGVCLGCLRPEAPDLPLCVDHCHATGLVRGLLCTPCNIALGNVYEDRQTLVRLHKYLSSFTSVSAPPEQGQTDGTSEGWEYEGKPP